MAVFNKKTTVVTRQCGDKDAKVSAWLSEAKMKEIGVSVSDFLFVSKGWTGSLSCRAVVRGELPQGYSDDTILLSADCMYEGSFKDGYTVSCWKHDIWS